MDTDVRNRLSLAHYEKFDAIAQDLGIDRLISLVPYDKEILTNGYNAGDIHFNDCTKLSKWDRMDVYVRWLVGRKVWSLSDTVCVLKHVARYYIVCADAPDSVE